MSELFTLSAPDLAALLCSRVCHDIISPVGAINNGLELLDEGGADEDAMNLIRQSAKNASARLQFARIAFGAAGSAGMQIDTGDAEAVTTAFLANEKPELVVERRTGAAAEEPGEAAAQSRPGGAGSDSARRQDHGHAGRCPDPAEIHARLERADAARAAEIPRAAFRTQARGTDRRPFGAALLHAASRARGEDDDLDPRQCRRGRADRQPERSTQSYR